ncbi:hypothetical protein MMC10_008755 [Thelotrema lepadinum]|nr:hypothetical protein [Thelotrema lepadinum]
MGKLKYLTVDPTNAVEPTRDRPPAHPKAESLPAPKSSAVHPKLGGGSENASIYFVGTATTILEWHGMRLMTDPNFLHSGDHVHLGPGVTGTRQTNPAVDLHDLPRIDLVCLSHYHAPPTIANSPPPPRERESSDHFDEKVEASLRRDLPIITTPHAKAHLAGKPDGEAFTAVTELDVWESAVVRIEGEKEGKGKGDGGGDGEEQAAVKVTGMPGKHVPQGVLGTLNDLVAAVPPTNGWMIELGSEGAAKSEGEGEGEFRCGYRIYISGDTLMVDDLKDIPKYLESQGKGGVDLMLVHLGGTTVPSPAVPLLMITMDAEMGVQLVRLIEPEVTIPIHYE